jgi:3-hexulose-6-phosphate synthase
MKLQLALDMPDLATGLEIAGQTAMYVDVIEAGTPLLIREGIRAIRELRRRFRGRPIVADIKVIDAGEPIAELAFAAGASIVTVLGCASDTVIARVVKASRAYDGMVMADTLSVVDIVARATQLLDLGVHSLCLNRRGLLKAKTKEEGVELIGDLVSRIQLPVYIAGGIYPPELTLLRSLPLAGVIIGEAITGAPQPRVVAKQMREILDRASK